MDSRADAGEQVEPLNSLPGARARRWRISPQARQIPISGQPDRSSKPSAAGAPVGLGMTVGFNTDRRIGAINWSIRAVTGTPFKRGSFQCRSADHKAFGAACRQRKPAWLLHGSAPAG